MDFVSNSPHMGGLDAYGDCPRRYGRMQHGRSLLDEFTMQRFMPRIENLYMRFERVQLRMSSGTERNRFPLRFSTTGREDA